MHFSESRYVDSKQPSDIPDVFPGYTLRFQPHKPVSVAQAAAALAAGSASETVSERVSEMESYRAADEVFREEAREQREIIEAVAARGEEIVKQLEEDKGALAETRATVEEAIKVRRLLVNFSDGMS